MRRLWRAVPEDHLLDPRLVRFRRLAAIGATVGVLAGLVGCQGANSVASQADTTCIPNCQGRACGGDGCGGQCGEGSGCTPEGQTTAGTTGAQRCDLSCGELGFQCGEHCGESCGECAGQTGCVDHVCACLPSCDASTCGQADGCGGTCGPCESTSSCEGCALQLVVVDHKSSGGLLSEITLALYQQSTPELPRPTMADLRLSVSGPATLTKVGLGEPMMAAGKTLFVSPETGRPFQILENRVHQFLVFSTGSTAPIEPGLWLVLRFRIGPQSDSETANWTAAPAVFSIVERQETLAPATADATLWGGGYGDPVVVWAQAGLLEDN